MNTSVSLVPYTGEIGLNKIEGIVRFCPYPLVAAPEDEDTTIYVNYGSCAVPCPSIVFVPDEWERTVSVLHVLGLVSVLLSSLVLLGHLCHYNSKKYIRTMFIGGFCASSVVLCVFLLANTGSSITCNSEAHYVEKAPLCVLQAFCLVFCFTWVVTWSVIFSLDVYNHISSISPDYDSSCHHRKYTTVALLVSFAVAIIPFVADNLGFDPEANIPICFFLFSQDSTYFWFLFYGPVWLLVVACTAITLAAMARIQTIYVNSREYDRMRAKMRRKGGGRRRGNAGGRRITDRYNSSSPNGGSGGGSFQNRQYFASLASSYNSRGEGGQQYLYEPPRGAAPAGGSAQAVDMDFSADSVQEQQQRLQQVQLTRSTGNRGAQHSNLYYDDDRDILSAVDENGELEWSVSDGTGSKHGAQLASAHDLARSSQSVSSRSTAASASASASATATGVVVSTHSPPLPMAHADSSTVPHHTAGKASDLGSDEGEGEDDVEGDDSDESDDNDNDDSTYNSGGTASDRSRSQSGGAERLMSTTSGLWSTSSGDRRSTPQGGENGDDDDDDDTYAEEARSNADKNSGTDRAGNDCDSPSAPLLGGKSRRSKVSKSTRVTPRRGREVSEGSTAGVFISTPQSAVDDPPSSWITWLMTRQEKPGKVDNSSGAKNPTGEQQKMNESSFQPASKGVLGGSLWRSQAAGRSPFSRVTSNATDTTYSQRDSDLTDTALSVTASTLYSTWRDNGKSIIFVLIFCITTLYVAPVLLYIYYFDYDTTKDATVDFVQCLVTAAINCTAPVGTMMTQDTVDDCAAAACGPHPHPRPNRPLLMSVLLWMGALGILPSIIFGFTGGGESTDEGEDEEEGANANNFPQQNVFDLSDGSGARGKYQQVHQPNQLYHR